jgi:large subunit ribosomal protein L29
MKKSAALSSMRESSNAELVARVKRTEEELFQHKLKRYTNQLENTNLIRAARREIARAKTIVSQRKAGVEKGKE